MASLLQMRLVDVSWSDLETFLALTETEVALRPPEGPFLDYKSGKIDDAGKTVAAMSNSGGGWIILGVDEQNKLPIAITGVPVGEEDRIMNQILSTVRPRPTVATTVLRSGGKSVVLVRIDPGDATPYAFLKGGDDHFPVRRGASDKPATRDEIIALAQGGQVGSTGVAAAPFPNEPRLKPLAAASLEQGRSGQTWVSAERVVRLLSWPVSRSSGSQHGDDDTAFERVVEASTGGTILRDTQVWDMDEMEFDLVHPTHCSERWRIARRLEIGVGVDLNREGRWDLARSLQRTSELAAVVRRWDATVPFQGARMLALDMPHHQLAIHPDSISQVGDLDSRPLDERFRALGTGASTQGRFIARVPPEGGRVEWMNALTEVWLPVLRQRAWYRGSRDRLAMYIEQHMS